MSTTTIIAKPALEQATVLHHPSPADVYRRLGRRTFAMLSTVSPAGWPHAAGVLYELEGDSLFINTLSHSRKGRNMAANPKVGVSIPIRRLPVGPPSSVQFQGTAELLATDHPTIQALVADGKLRSLTRHGELHLPGSVFVRITLPRRLLTYGLGMPLRSLIKDPLAAAGSVDMGELTGAQA
ncbi:MAG: hypothetical protein HKN24_09245 [Acidimicrobiales bacterium]|nr:hypothetical protein [Acidimicrobiales bacterium]